LNHFEFLSLNDNRTANPMARLTWVATIVPAVTLKDSSVNQATATAKVIAKGDDYQVQKAMLEGLVEAMTGAGFEISAAW
jgi:hypothetical protein